MREYRQLMEQQQAKELRMTVFGLVILFLCIGSLLVGRTLFQSRSEPTPAATLPVTAAPATLTAVLAPLPTNTPTPVSTNTPILAQTPLPLSTTSPPISGTTPSSDPQADVISYTSLTPVQDAPAGVDIRAASIGSDQRVTLQTTGDAPPELSGWADGQIRLWINLYDPIPDPPTVYTEWLFALDLDGNVETGRPAGSLRINPDLGVEVAIGVDYDPNSQAYETYFLVWDTAQASWTDGPAGAQFIVSDSRTIIGLALSMDTLTQSVARISGVTVLPETVKGRAAALATATEKIIDFYPDLPD